MPGRRNRPVTIRATTRKGAASGQADDIQSETLRPPGIRSQAARSEPAGPGPRSLPAIPGGHPAKDRSVDSLVSTLLPLIVAAIVVTLSLRLRQTAWTTVSAWNFGLDYRDGRFVKVLEPGRYFTPGSRRVIHAVRRTEQVLATPPVEATSKDRLPFRLSAYLTYRVVEPREAFENDFADKLTYAARVALAEIAAGLSLEELLSERPALGEALKATIGETVCGCRIEKAAIGEVTLPPEIRRLFSEVERARLEGAAALERARGEQAALRSLANSARMLKGNPELMNLRLLQSVSGSAKASPTLVLSPSAFWPLSPVRPDEEVPRESQDDIR